MVKINNSNWVIWKSRTEDCLTIKDFLDTIKGEEERPRGIYHLD